MGVTHSIRPTLIPDAMKVRRADWAPGPKLRRLIPPLARILMLHAVIPHWSALLAASWAARIAAYGEPSSFLDFTFIPPVTLAYVSQPVKSVTIILVQFLVLNMKHVPRWVLSSVGWASSPCLGVNSTAASCAWEESIGDKFFEISNQKKMDRERAAERVTAKRMKNKQQI